MSPENIKILFVTTWFPHKENQHKGIFILEHARAVAASGVEVRVLFINIIHSNCFFQCKDETYFEDNLKVYKKEIKSVFWKFFYIIPYLWQRLGLSVFNKKIIHEFKPDIIHSHVSFPALIIGDFIAKKYNIPQVLTEHWSGLENHLKKNIFSYITKNAYTRISSIIVVSEFLKKKIRNLIPEKDIIVIPNVVSEDFCFSGYEKDENEYRFTCIANWQSPKRLDLIIESLNKFSEENKTTIFLNVIGIGFQQENYESKIFNPLIKIKYHGRKTKKEIQDIFKQTDFFIHASDYETFSIVIAEALQCGIPVLASDVAAIPELINSQSGILSQNTIEDFIEKTGKLIQQEWDREKIASDSKLKFTSSEIGLIHKKIYKQLLGIEKD
ncbi:MAG: hypothetical protein A2275_13540 [Bacteroidetes bacterium RIFOXYA12_FULL_35_11]|nr:MAG: hypothetical protein A2X01_20315 [Bacteroidetes bacterium GWF2_35_48]OFY82541.1 MAG: hypothetical protein A2275_13540 [Bacteroidetes bacterium RIFOXYA12_FULL_35_11]OFY93551.1 MAG: hypothetical protein A2491_09300 [Bacteroidetes bacterium RIFOXYC12_FULL_35_7]HBX51160.1 hypothetical protein [Bacteroidales bacterium]